MNFDSAGTRCAAWLFLPENAAGRAPCVVMAHGFAGVREDRLDAFAERFAQAGLAVLVFDYRHFGASDGQPRQLLDIGQELDDWRAAIGFARSLDQVDPERVAIWGTSFSGGHVLTLSAEDANLAAVICQAPFTDGLHTTGSVSLRHSLRLTVAGLRDQLGALIGRPPYLVDVAGAPGSLAMMTTPDALPGYRSLATTGTNGCRRVAARIALRLPFYRPALLADRIRPPILFCICDQDVVVAPEPALAAAARAPRAEVKRYPLGHFDVYTGAGFEQAVSDQIEFLSRHLMEKAGGRQRAAGG
ncbi:MAG TPA: alpha/beta fold hydrolase [Pirellulales bacterium]|nr:alpha/beta fold hydrolase [Pirellulales bacterium]